MKQIIKILLVDDHVIVRNGLKLVLELHEQLEVCGEAGTLKEAMALISNENPDVVLLDYKLTDGDGVIGCINIKNKFPLIKVIMLTAYAQEHTVMEALKAGADGYLLKNIESEELINMIFSVCKGGSALDPLVAKCIISNINNAHKNNDNEQRLSPKENEILKMIGSGKTNKEIAQAQQISEKTVRNYVSSIFKKINASNRTEAAIHWLKSGYPDKV